MVYYNEIDPYAAQWLRNLIAAGHIAKGEVDERSIQLVDSADLAGFAQCHFFAGIGVWSHALRLAGWPDDKPVWTGSCPCQPFSAAGKRNGFDDERHLWPDFFRLIRERRPSVVFGEQVASKDGLEWLDLVQADLEGAGYTSAAADLCAAGVGAPHIRQRLYWVADADDPRLEGRGAVRQRADQCVVGPNGVANGLVDASDERHERHSGDGREAQRRSEHADGVVGLANASSERCNGIDPRLRGRRQQQDCVEAAGGREDVRPRRFLSARELAQIPYTGRYVDPARNPSPTNGYWRDADWLFCRDGKWRPVEPGTFPLAHGATSRVGRLRAYGNAIVPQVAQAFIEAFMECRP
jgi:DNA (cytosine-5)-methyltransferase 1